MSLNIVAGSKATFLTSDRSVELADNDVAVYAAGYSERLDGLREGIYRFNGQVLDFDVGGASRYINMLEKLSMLVHGVELDEVRNRPDLYIGRPFVELLVFSDNEGAIGPKTSRKLANDFASHADQIQQSITPISIQPQPTSVNFLQRLRQFLAKKPMHPMEDPTDLLDLYTEFRIAFELASDDGFVVFQ